MVEILQTSNKTSVFVRSYCNDVYQNILHILALSILHALANIEDTNNQIRLQLECFSRIHGHLIAQHVDYGRRAAIRIQQDLSEAANPLAQNRCHDSIGEAVSAGLRSGKCGDNVLLASDRVVACRLIFQKRLRSALVWLPIQLHVAERSAFSNGARYAASLFSRYPASCSFADSSKK
jgi:hypothetical protein